ncbi:MAG TPA: hypothetical protein VHD33_06260, partial [Legionellaceae bacterium]|nr:hypothetical protein [Legionellaceae bacterium]
MFIIENKWFRPNPTHAIFDFHLPGYPVIPGAISAGFIHQAHREQYSQNTAVDILLQRPITKYTQFKLSIQSNLSQLSDINANPLVTLRPTNNPKQPHILQISNIKKSASRIKRPSELIFHNEFFYYENIAECIIHYENILATRSYLSSLMHKNYFICLETMGNLAMELCLSTPQEVFLFHSFKDVWFNWQKISGELIITTLARRLNSKLIQWSAQIKNKNKVL